MYIKKLKKYIFNIDKFNVIVYNYIESGDNYVIKEERIYR